MRKGATKTTDHHIVPASRGGPKQMWNKYPWRIVEHWAWHYLFHNYLPSEAITIIERNWALPSGDLNVEKMGTKMADAWNEVFGDRTTQQAVQYIRDRFLPVEKAFFLKKKLKKKRKAARVKKGGQKGSRLRVAERKKEKNKRTERRTRMAKKRQKNNK